MNTPWRMFHLKIGGRVFAGFGIMVAVLAMLAVLSHLGLNNVVHRFGEYQESNGHARTMLEIERTALELQRSVMLYTYSGYEGVLQRVLHSQRNLDNRLTQAKDAVQNGRGRDVVERMGEHFRRYTENFDVAVEERTLRDHLVEEQLEPTHNRIVQGLDLFLNESMGKGDMKGAALAGLALEKLQQAHHNALAFLSQPDSPLVAGAQDLLKLLAEAFRQLKEHVRDDHGRLEEIDRLATLSPAYEQALMGVVRASRAYMHLVYVVMGGEAAEILHLAKELKDGALAEQNRLEQEIGGNVRKSQRTLIILSLIMVLLALLLAWGITRTIAIPIREMTTTLTNLARGKVDAEIPNRGRNDEIGAMAMAAHVFKEKAHELENASQYKSEFLANMSHELRTPLNSLLILARILSANEDGTLSARQVEMARIIHDSGKDLLRLINDILDLSKVEAGRMDLYPETRTLAEFGQNIDRFFRHMAEGKGLAFQVEIASDLPAVLTTDWGKVEQIVRNFLSNALKFTAEGQVTVRLGKPKRGLVLMNPDLDPTAMMGITVADTGIGIPEDKQEQIFEPFRQVDGSISRKYGGTGLGLSISRRFADLLGGEIQVVSRLGQGAAFTLNLPLRGRFPEETGKIIAPNADSLTGETFRGRSESSFRDSTRTLLLVDDDPRNIFALRQMLELRVGTVLTAGDGREALNILSGRADVDLVLMDIMMPVMDGYQAMREIRGDPRHDRMPIIALTAKAMAGDREKCLEAGASDYLAKPVEMERLLATLAAWLPARPVLLDKVHPRSMNGSEQASPPVGKMPEVPLPSVPLPTVNAKGNPPTILIVDDDMRYTFSLAQWFQKRAGKAWMAQNGTKALRMLEQHGHDIDLVLLDLTLPDMDGCDTLSAIRDGWPGIPVIMVSAWDDARQRCLKAGASAYLVKPVPEELLLANMATVWAPVAPSWEV
ncbi:MAG: response regulator [Magnetococcales bacterium]|nr:response regulator [Magnetococcales bacterium]